MARDWLQISLEPLRTSVNATGPQWVIPMVEPPLQSKVMAETTDVEVMEFPEHVKEQLDKVYAERRVKDLDHQIELLQKQIKWFDRVIAAYYATMVGGLLLLLTMWLWQEVGQ